MMDAEDNWLMKTARGNQETGTPTPVPAPTPPPEPVPAPIPPPPLITPDIEKREIPPDQITQRDTEGQSGNRNNFYAQTANRHCRICAFFFKTWSLHSTAWPKASPTDFANSPSL